MLKIDEQHICVLCPVCDGQGFIGERPENEYKDDEVQVEPCRCCKGLTIVLVPLQRITILGSIKKAENGFTVEAATDESGAGEENGGTSGDADPASGKD